MATKAPPPPREDYDDAPRPRRRPVERPEPSDISGNWKQTSKAISSEQAAVRFLGVQILADLVTFCLGRSIDSMGQIPAIVVVLFILLVLGPAIMSLIMGMIARIGALSVPPETNAGGTAWASMFCALGGMLSILMIGFGFLVSIDGNRRDAEPVLMMAVLGGFLMAAGAVVTFAALVAQVGITTGSREISAGIGRMGVGFMVCLLISLVLGGCGSVLMQGFSSHHSGYNNGPDFDALAKILAFTALLSSGIMLVLYHSLLSSARQALQTASGRG